MSAAAQARPSRRRRPSGGEENGGESAKIEPASDAARGGSEPSTTAAATKASEEWKQKLESAKASRPPGAIRRIQKELLEIQREAPCDVKVVPADEDLFSWTSIIKGPPDSVYSGGTFYLDISFPDEYPFRPPKVTFRTRIYHCNVSTDGSICLDILKDNWSPALTITQVMLSILALMTNPNPDDPLVPHIAKQYMNERDAYDERARSWTQRYAIS